MLSVLTHSLDFRWAIVHQNKNNRTVVWFRLLRFFYLRGVVSKATDEKINEVGTYCRTLRINVSNAKKIAERELRALAKTSYNMQHCDNGLVPVPSKIFFSMTLFYAVSNPKKCWQSFTGRALTRIQ